MAREEEQKKFLQSQGLGDANQVALAADASFRRYYRIELDEQSWVLMDAPPNRENVQQFITIAKYLRAIGINAPEIFGEDLKNGFLLIEDFGDQKFSTILKTSDHQQEAKLYEEAISLLVKLQKTFPPSWLPRYTTNILMREVDLFIDWFWPIAKTTPISASERKTYREAWSNVLLAIANQKNVLVLRDFHVDNLMWLTGRKGIQQIGLLDFQDALSGPSIYDLVSLLEDVRRDVRTDLVHNLKERFCASQKLEDKEFEYIYSTLTAQRNTKILGIFTRLWRRDGKNQYLDLLPRTWHLLDKSLKNPALAPLQQWFGEHFPESSRALKPDGKL
ncbi:MAG: phosphotransferase [Pseudomonadota bacterium]|nr:phosphotransferase [Pseudomonadota bacterium]